MKTNLILLTITSLFITACSPFGNVSVVEISTPDLAWENASYDFGNQAVGSMHIATFTLINRGNTAATGCDSVQLSDNVNFSIDLNNCTESSMESGATCDVDIASHPTSTGPKSLIISRECENNIEVVTDANQIVVTAVPPPLPLLAWSPLTHDFSTINVGSNSAVQAFTLSNSGSLDATSCSTPTLSNPTDFTVTANGCGTSPVTAGGSCLFSVRANPTSVGLKTATISRTCGVGGTVATLSNQITVTGAPAPILTWNTSNQYYGSVVTGSNSSNLNLILTNTGTLTATGCSAPVLDDVVNFTMVSNTCGTTDLNVSSSCTATIRANPASIGLITASVSRSCASGVTGSANVSVTGAAPTANLAWNPTSVYYGGLTVGLSTSNVVVTLLNSGLANATGCSAPVLNDTTNFSITSDTCGTADVSASGGSCTIQVQGHPTTVGHKVAQVSRTCSFGGTANVSLGVVGQALSEVVWRNEYAWTTFGPISVTSNSSSYYFINNNSVSLTGCSVPTISDVTQFAIVSNACNTTTMAPYSSCEVQLQASPINLGVQILTLSRTCDQTGVVSATPSFYGTSSTTTQISSNGKDSCALQSDGTIKCWGANWFGARGYGVASSPSNQLTIPNLVSGISNAIQVSNGADYACAVLNDNSVKCWGYNNYGQLGDGTTTQRLSPVVVPSLSNVTFVSAGVSSTCALISDGTVKCWGAGGSGQLGDGNQMQQLSPVTVSALTNVTKISTGYDYACALINDGTIKCWGVNTYGQLGDGGTSMQLTPVQVSGITTATQIASGSNSTCALLLDQTIKCWGYGVVGGLGNGALTTSYTPVSVSGILNAVSISVANANNSTACALLSDQTVKCWGQNHAGQLGDGTTTMRSTPVLVTGLTGASEVSITGNFGCALLNTGRVKCWGDNSLGQMGDGTFSYKNIPQVVSGLTSVTSVSEGSKHTCALKSDGTVVCWGENNYGQLGNSTITDSATPVIVAGVSGATQVSSGSFHACALLSDETVKCWGSNSNGEAGDGTSGNIKSTPVVVAGLSGVTQISSSMNFTCAILNDSTVKCWGSNYYGQFGNGATATNQVTPVAATGINNAVQIVTGFWHACARLSDQSVKCWGNNNRGQLGDGTTTQRLTPVPVLGLTTSTDLTSGMFYSCSILSNQTVKCWGANDYNMLGDFAYNSNQSTPVLMIGINNAVQLSSGTYFNCIRLATNTVKCLGINTAGVAGNGLIDPYVSNVFYNGLNQTNILTFGVGSSVKSHRCMVDTGNQVLCVGDNQNSQLGISAWGLHNVSGL